MRIRQKCYLWWAFLIILLLLPVALGATEITADNDSICRTGNPAASRQRYASGFEVVNESSRLVSATAGDLVSVAFRIINKTSGVTEFDEQLVLPPDWTSETIASSFVMSDRSSVTRVYFLRSPEDAPTGTCRVECVITDRRNPGQQASNYCLVAITAVSRQQEPANEAAADAVIPGASVSQLPWFTRNPTQKNIAAGQKDHESEDEAAERPREIISDTVEQITEQTAEDRADDKAEDRAEGKADYRVEERVENKAEKRLFAESVDKSGRKEKTAAVESADKSEFFIGNPTQLRAASAAAVLPVTTVVATPSFLLINDAVTALDRPPPLIFNPIKDVMVLDIRPPAIFATAAAAVPEKQDLLAAGDSLGSGAGSVADQGSGEADKKLELTVGRSDKIAVRAASSAVYWLNPGELVSVRVVSTNVSGRDYNLVEELQLPEGFAPLIPPEEFSLAPGEAQTGLVSFVVPRNAASDKYVGRYQLKDRDSGELVNYVEIAFAVKKINLVRMFTEDVQMGHACRRKPPGGASNWQ